VFNQIKTVFTVLLCTVQSYIVRVLKVQWHYSLQLSKNNVKHSCCTRHPVKAGTCSVQWVIWNLLSAATVLWISGHSGGSVLARRWGTPWKKPLNGRWRWQSGIQFAKEKLDGWEAMKAVQRVWAWFSKISKTFYCHLRITKQGSIHVPHISGERNIITGIFMQFSEFKVFWKCILH